jgi:hypothetical protein
MIEKLLFILTLLFSLTSLNKLYELLVIFKVSNEDIQNKLHYKAVNLNNKVNIGDVVSQTFSYFTF